MSVRTGTVAPVGINALPAASGAPGTWLRFGKFIRHGWVGSEFLVARRVLPDASRSVLHATIEGLVEPPDARGSSTSSGV
jgi:branched-chain amino acid transport system substrate-binding protein